MDDFERELKQDFLAESEDFLNKSEEAFLRLESERENQDLINEIFRLAHNLKGTSKAVGFDQLASFTHIAENLILKIKEKELIASDSIVSALLEFKDVVGTMVAGLIEDFDATFDTQAMEQKLSALANGEDAGDTEPQIEKGEPELSGDEITNDSCPTDGSDHESREINQSFLDQETAEMGFEATLEAGDGFEEMEAAKFESGIENMDIGKAQVIEAPDPATPNNQMTSEAAIELSDVNATEIPSNSSTPTKTTVKSDEEKTPSVSDLKLIEVESPSAKEGAQKPNTPVHNASQTKSNSAPPGATPPSKKRNEDESIRVKLEKIDELNNIVGEMVILQTVLSQRRFAYIEDDLANKSIAQLGKLFKETQELTMSLRMLPLKNTFQKMNRIVRDTSKALGKDVRLVLNGEETEVDKTVLEKISDPLVHIIRNAVDHGLETPAERSESGKFPEGEVLLKAYHEGSNLIIQVNDDGKGINPDVIRKIAIEKQVIKENSNMTDDAVIQLIFHPGFSTKEKVTEVSGRGVGMDVVKTNIESLGGEVKLKSVIGKGSIFKISLPLTLAVIDGIVISAGTENFVIPLAQVHELTQIENDQIEIFTGGAQLIRLRGEVLPLFHINAKLGQPRLQRESEIIVIVRGLDHDFGVVIDDVINQQQIVIKKLGEDIRNKKGFMGSAIMGDGKPSFIVDLFELFKGDFRKSRNYEKLLQEASAA